MKIQIIGQAVLRAKPTIKVGKQRCETIDTEANPLFTHCTTLGQVVTTFESFWNDTNPTSREIVIVDGAITQ